MIVVADLVALEATGGDSCAPVPACLLSRHAEQAAQLPRPVLLFPARERAVVRRLIEVKYDEDAGQLVELDSVDHIDSLTIASRRR